MPSTACLTLNKDGGLSGLVGGYRDWREVYGRDTFNVPSGGATRETYYHQNQIAMYYALKRNADGLPDPKTGRNTAISSAYRFTARPAFVVDPPVALAVDQPSYPGGDRTSGRVSCTPPARGSSHRNSAGASRRWRSRPPMCRRPSRKSRITSRAYNPDHATPVPAARS
jgi:hypothetical protein